MSSAAAIDWALIVTARTAVSVSSSLGKAGEHPAASGDDRQKFLALVSMRNPRVPAATPKCKANRGAWRAWSDAISRGTRSHSVGNTMDAKRYCGRSRRARRTTALTRSPDAFQDTPGNGPKPVNKTAGRLSVGSGGSAVIFDTWFDSGCSASLQCEGCQTAIMAKMRSTARVGSSVPLRTEASIPGSSAAICGLAFSAAMSRFSSISRIHDTACAWRRS